MALAKSSDPRGLKRICLSCSTRFYDLNKRPIICPNCGTEFTGEIKVKARRGRLSALEDADPVLGAAQVDSDVADELEEEEDAKEVSLDEVAASDDAGDDDDDTAIDLDDDLDDDDLDDDDLDDDDDDLDVDIDDEK